MKRLAKAFIVTFLLATLIFCFPACTENAPATQTTTVPSTAPAGETAWSWPDRLTVMTLTVGTAAYSVTASWVPLLEKSTGVRVKQIPVAGDAETAKMNAQGAFDIGMFENEEFMNWAEGNLAYLGVPRADLRIAGLCYMTYWGFCTRGDTGIKTIYDIKKMVDEGKTVKIGNSAVSPLLSMTTKEGLAAFLDIDPEKLTMVPVVAYPGLYSGLGDGSFDITWITPTSALCYELEANPKGIVWLPLPVDDVEGWARFSKVRPGVTPSKVEFGVPTAIGQELGASWWMYSTLEETNEELTYNLSKWWHENYDKYKDSYVANATASTEYFRMYLDTACIPIHSGTIKFLREIGMWTDKDDEWNQKAIDLLDQYNNAWAKAEKEAADKNIKISADNEEWAALWASYKKDIPRFTHR